MQTTRRRQTTLFVAFAIANLAFATMAIACFFTVWDTIGQLTAMLVVLVVWVIVAFWFQPRLLYYAQIYGLMKLKAQAAPVEDGVADLSSPAWVAHLKGKGFAVSMDNGAFVLMHRISKDPTRLFVSKSMLDILILIRDAGLPFRHPAVTEAINRLENDFLKQKIRLRNNAVVILKSGDAIDEPMREALEQVVFEKQGERGIAVIHAFYERGAGRLHYLHSDTYAPTVYYRYAADMFRTTYRTFTIKGR